MPTQRENSTPVRSTSALTAGTSGHYFILLRGASAERMRQWQDSPQRAARRPCDDLGVM